MKLPFLKGDPTEALAKARAALAADDAKLAALRIERSAPLAESDDLAPIEAIDREIEALRRAVGIRRDRIGLLEAECREEATEKREKERQTLVDKLVKPKALDRNAKAARLEQLIKQMGDAYFDLIGSEPIVDEWPHGPLGHRFGTINADAIRQEVAWALFSAGRPTGGRTILPGPTNAGLGRHRHRPQGNCSDRRRAVRKSFSAFA
jgi:hypothetical protein